VQEETVNAQTIATTGFPAVGAGDHAPPPLAPTLTSAQTPAPTEPSSRSLASGLLDTSSSTWVDEARRLAAAASLSAVFGVALGLRHGGFSLAWGAMGAPLGIVAVGALAAPALGILLSLADARLEALDLARATSRAAVKAGMLLAGVAPATALFVVTVEDAITVTIVGLGALILAGVVAARSFQHDLEPALSKTPRTQGAVVRLAVWAFLAFAAILALRVWCLALPMLAVPS
jgi:hypothetical protein